MVKELLCSHVDVWLPGLRSVASSGMGEIVSLPFASTPRSRGSISICIDVCGWQPGKLRGGAHPVAPKITRRSVPSRLEVALLPVRAA